MSIVDYYNNNAQIWSFLMVIKTKQESIFDKYVDKFNLIDIGSRIWKLNNRNR